MVCVCDRYACVNSPLRKVRNRVIAIFGSKRGADEPPRRSDMSATRRPSLAGGGGIAAVPAVSALALPGHPGFDPQGSYLRVWSNGTGGRA